VKPLTKMTDSEKDRLRRVKMLAKYGPKLSRRKLAEFITKLARANKLL